MILSRYTASGWRSTVSVSAVSMIRKRVWSVLSAEIRLRAWWQSVMEKSSVQSSAGMMAEEQDFIMSVYQENYRKHGIGQKLVERCLAALKAEKISKVNLIAFKLNEIGNRFWQSLGWKYCDNVNYYEYVLNEENITVFNP